MTLTAHHSSCMLSVSAGNQCLLPAMKGEKMETWALLARSEMLVAVEHHGTGVGCSCRSYQRRGKSSVNSHNLISLFTCQSIVYLRRPYQQRNAWLLYHKSIAAWRSTTLPVSALFIHYKHCSLTKTMARSLIVLDQHSTNTSHHICTGTGPSLSRTQHRKLDYCTPSPCSMTVLQMA